MFFTLRFANGCIKKWEEFNFGKEEIITKKFISFKSKENIHKKEVRPYHMVSAIKASSVTL